MVVINSDNMKEEEHDNGDSSVAKLKIIQEYSDSKMSVTDNQNCIENHDGPATEVDLYDDIEPVNHCSTNGEKRSDSVDQSSHQDYSSVSNVVSSDPVVTTEAPAASDIFGQLVSDTLMQSEIVADNNDTHQTNSYQRVPAEPTDKQENGNFNCNQMEVSFSISQPTADNTQSEEGREGGEREEEEDEEGDYEELEEEEHLSSDEFDEDEYRAAQMQSHSGDGAAHESSIMVIDSDDSDSEECDDEQLEEEEDEDDDEEEGEGEEEEEEEGVLAEEDDNELDYERQQEGDSELQSEGTRPQHHQHTTVNNNDGPIAKNGDMSSSNKYQKLCEPISESDIITENDYTDKMAHGNGNGHLTVSYNENKANEKINTSLAREHSSIMKKVQFNRELNTLKRQGISVSNQYSGVDEAEAFEFDEEEGWDALQEWSQERDQQQRKANKQQKQQSLHTKSNSINHNSSSNSNCIGKSNHSSVQQHSNTEQQMLNSTESTSTLPLHKAADPASTTPPCVDANAGKIITTPPTVIVPLLNETKGHFEIGRCVADDPALAMHLFSVTVIFTKDLNMVVPGAVLRSCREGPHFSYPLIGCPVHTDPITQLSNTQYPGERANARLVSTELALRQYLEQQKVLPLALMIGELRLATCSVDLKTLAVGNKVEGVFELIPAEGNMAGVSASSQQRAVVGICIELTRLEKEKPESSKSNLADTESKSQEPKRPQENMIFDEAAGPSKKRELLNSSSGNLSLSRNDSLNFSSARKQLKQDLMPPSKKRKFDISNDGESEFKKKDQDQQWDEAHDDFLKWREAQEKVFWKQWLVREKKMQDSLSQEWRARVEGLEGELQEQLEAVQEERCYMEEEARRLQEREQRCREREEQLLQLQEDVLQQQAALGAQLRLQQEPQQHQQPAHRLAITQGRVGTGDHKQYYKSRWLRGVATTHKRWTSERSPDQSSPAVGGSPWRQASTSRLPTPPSAGSRFPVAGGSRLTESLSSSLLPTTSIRPGRYDTVAVDEIARLTKERRILVAKRGAEDEVRALDRTIEQLIDASGI